MPYRELSESAADTESIALDSFTPFPAETFDPANLCTVGVTWGFREEAELIAHGADYIIHKPMDLLDIC